MTELEKDTVNSQIFQEVMLQRRREKWGVAEGGRKVQRRHSSKAIKIKLCLYVLETAPPLHKENGWNPEVTLE